MTNRSFERDFRSPVHRQLDIVGEIEGVLGRGTPWDILAGTATDLKRSERAKLFSMQPDDLIHHLLPWVGEGQRPHELGNENFAHNVQRLFALWVNNDGERQRGLIHTFVNYPIPIDQLPIAGGREVRPNTEDSLVQLFAWSTSPESLVQGLEEYSGSLTLPPNPGEIIAARRIVKALRLKLVDERMEASEDQLDQVLERQRELVVNRFTPYAQSSHLRVEADVADIVLPLTPPSSSLDVPLPILFGGLFLPDVQDGRNARAFTQILLLTRLSQPAATPTYQETVQAINGWIAKTEATDDNGMFWHNIATLCQDAPKGVGGAFTTCLVEKLARKKDQHPSFWTSYWIVTGLNGIVAENDPLEVFSEEEVFFLARRVSAIILRQTKVPGAWRFFYPMLQILKTLEDIYPPVRLDDRYAKNKRRLESLL